MSWIQPVDFTILKAQTKQFLKELFIELFISSQISTPMISSHHKEHSNARNRGAVEDIFKKATKVEVLAMGLVYFISEHFRDEDELVRWASEVAMDTLRASVNIV
jgi:nucleolar MIF4G domain-containing protein 1